MILFLFVMTALPLFVVSCTGTQKKDDVVCVVSDQKMVQLLVDIHQADAYFGIDPARDQKIQSGQVKKAILEKHGITLEQYEQAVALYARKPLKLDTIYEKVLSRLSEMRAEQKPAKKQ